MKYELDELNKIIIIYDLPLLSYSQLSEIQNILFNSTYGNPFEWKIIMENRLSKINSVLFEN